MFGKRLVAGYSESIEEVGFRALPLPLLHRCSYGGENSLI